jgi:hypothetical protein
LLFFYEELLGFLPFEDWLAVEHGSGRRQRLQYQVQVVILAGADGPSDGGLGFSGVADAVEQGDEVLVVVLRLLGGPWPAGDNLVFLQELDDIIPLGSGLVLPDPDSQDLVEEVRGRDEGGAEDGGGTENGFQGSLAPNDHSHVVRETSARSDLRQDLHPEGAGPLGARCVELRGLSDYPDRRELHVLVGMEINLSAEFKTE